MSQNFIQFFVSTIYRAGSVATASTSTCVSKSLGDEESEEEVSDSQLLECFSQS